MVRDWKSWHPRNDDKATRRLLIVGFSTLLTSACTSFAVWLLPPVHRASIELSWEGPAPFGWTEAKARSAADPNQPISSDLLGRIPDSFDEIITQALRRDGSASRRVGIDPIGRQAVLVWAEASDPDVARERSERIADTLTTQTLRPARLISNGSLPRVEEFPPRSGDGDDALQRELQQARNDLQSVEEQFAAFNDERRPASKAEEIESAVGDARSRLDAVKRERQEGSLVLSALNAGNASEIPAAWRSDASDRWNELRRTVTTLSNSINELSETLLDDHPRMRIARLRLGQLETDLRSATSAFRSELEDRLAGSRVREDELKTALATFEDAEAAEKRRDEERQDLANRVSIARGIVKHLEQSVAVSNPLPTTSNAEAAEATDQPPPVEKRVLPTRMRHISIWPAALGGAIIGFLGSAAALRLGRTSRNRRSSSAIIDAVSPPAEPPLTPTLNGYEFATVDDVIDGLMTSSIARVIVASPTHGSERSLSVDIARRLALRGRSVALVDFCRDQNSAKAMGVGSGFRGISDLVRGEATLTEVVRRDFATSADVIGGGTEDVQERTEGGLKNRNMLDLIERSYQTLVVDCGNMEPRAIRSVLDSDSALLVNADPCTRSEIETAISALRDVGLADLILVRDRPVI